MAAVMLVISHIVKRYGTRVAVDDLSLEVRPGEILGLLGPNGAGKSTTMHVATGLLRPDAGSVAIGGQITWTIDVSNLGDSIATHVVLVDNLPAGAVWTEDEDICEISGPVGSQVLTCNVGNLTAHHTRTYHVVGIATACGEVTNTASATADLEADDLLGAINDATHSFAAGLFAIAAILVAGAAAALRLPDRA